MMKRFLPLILFFCPLALRAQSSFLVTVQSTTGVAVTGATVTLTCTDVNVGCSGKGPFTGTSTNGNAPFTAIPPGNYIVRVTGQGVLTYTYALQVTGGGAGNVTVTAASNIVLPVTTSPSSITVTDFFILLNTNVNTVTISGTPNTGDEVVITLIQDGTGGWLFTWPANFLNPPTLQLLANQTTAMTFQFCGTAGSGPACPANSWQATDVGASGIIGNLTTGFLPKATTPATIGNSHVDDGITTPATVTSSEPLAAAGFISTANCPPGGSGTAGCDILGQGTAPNTLVTNAIINHAGPSVTAHHRVLPSAAATGILHEVADTDTNGLARMTDSVSAVNLANADVTGVLPVANGGTNSSIGGIPGFFVENCTTDAICATQALTTPGTTNSNGDQDTASGTGGTSTLFFKGVTIPANTIVANKILRACAIFQHTTSGAAPTLQLSFNLGSTAIAQSGAMVLNNNITNKGFTYCFTVTGTAAAGGSVSVVGGYDGVLQATANTTVIQQIAQPVAGIATNGSLIASFSALWGAATAANNIILESQYVQVIN